MSIVTDAAALADHIGQACTAGLAAPAPHTLTRPVTVLARKVAGFYEGTMPLVEVIHLRRQTILTAGSQGSDLGQSFKAPSLFALRIRSAVDDTASPAIGVDDAQTEIYNITEAIESWFAVIAHRTLPDSGQVRRVLYAGPPFDWRGDVDGLYKVADGSMGQVLVGPITVLGLPRASS